MTLPDAQIVNVKSLINDELARKIDEDGLSLPEAFADLVLDYKGYTKERDWRAEHVSDGAKDFGIDFWDINADSRNVVVMQFKTFESESAAYLDDARRLSPDKIADIARVIDRLADTDSQNLDCNAQVRDFIHRYHSLLSKTKDERQSEDDFVSVKVMLCALAGDLTPQARRQLDDLKQRATFKANDVEVRVSVDLYMIDDLVQEKWREENTEWRDRDGKKRDVALVSVSGNVIEAAKSLVFFSRAIDLVRMFEDYGYQIFEPNVRCEIERSKVNEAIRKSVSTSRGRKEFKHLNNGLTIICESFEKIGKPIERIRIMRPGVINGLQTLKSVHDAYHELGEGEREQFEDNCEILVRLHMRNAVADYRNLVKSTNNQNPMLQRNLRANDSEQITYERLFAEHGWFYERKEGAWAAFKSDSKRWGTLAGKTTPDFRVGSTNRTVDNEQVGQCWLAYIGFANEAVQRRTDIFREDDIYNLIYLSVPVQHGSQYDFKLDTKEIGKTALARSPDPRSLLLSYILREVARKLAPSAKSHRDSAIERLGLSSQTRERQNEELNRDDAYLKGVILRAVSYIFPEVVGYCMYRAFGDRFAEKGAGVLMNGTARRLFEKPDFGALKSEFEDGGWTIDKNDLLQTFWYLFEHLIETLIASGWKEQWKMASNRTRFNYGIPTRQRIVKEIDEMDKFVQQSQLMRQWAVGINESKGVYRYIRNALSNF